MAHLGKGPRGFWNLKSETLNRPINPSDPSSPLVWDLQTPHSTSVDARFCSWKDTVFIGKNASVVFSKSEIIGQTQTMYMGLVSGRPLVF